MKFPAEVVSYQIVNRVEGKVAIIKLIVPESQVDKSYFVGGLVKNYAEFDVINVKNNVIPPQDKIEE